MGRLIKHTMGLCVFFAAVLGLAVVGWRRDPLPESLDILRLKDCTLPCWIGIVPGQTTLNEAGARIETAYDQALARGFSVDIATMPGVLGVTLARQRGPAEAIHILLSTNNDKVIHTILFDFNLNDGDRRTTLADFVSLLGPPAHLNVYNKYYMTLEYGDGQNGVLVAAQPQPRLGLLQSVDSVLLYSRAMVAPNPTQAYQSWRWRGFTIVGR